MLQRWWREGPVEGGGGRWVQLFGEDGVPKKPLMNQDELIKATRRRSRENKEHVCGG